MPAGLETRTQVAGSRGPGTTDQVFVASLTLLPAATIVDEDMAV